MNRIYLMLIIYLIPLADAIVLVVILEKIVSHGTSHANRRHVKTVEPVDQQIANPTSATVLLVSSFAIYIYFTLFCYDKIY